MPLSVTSRIEDGCAILELSGALTLGPSLNTLRDTARAVLSTNKVSGLILDLASVTATDSAGLGELTVIYTLTARRNCSLRLVKVSPRLLKLLELTRLDGLLQAAPDVAAAKKELKQK
jgi:anti-anti-sigma factor